MIRLLTIASLIYIGASQSAEPARAQQSPSPAAGEQHHHDGAHQDHHNHTDHRNHGDHHQKNDHSTDEKLVTLTRTPAIETALAQGGAPVLVEVLGVVCDFCAKAMDKTFGRRAEIAAVYVDLDTKLLNLVIKPGRDLTDTQIKKLVTRAGYKAAKIHRGVAIGEADHARHPA
ncbi:MAG: cation transporter [Pseudomonadota bacterium]